MKSLNVHKWISLVVNRSLVYVWFFRVILPSLSLKERPRLWLYLMVWYDLECCLPGVLLEWKIYSEHRVTANIFIGTRIECETGQSVQRQIQNVCHWQQQKYEVITAFFYMRRKLSPSVMVEAEDICFETLPIGFQRQPDRILMQTQQLPFTWVAYIGFHGLCLAISAFLFS